MKAVKAVSTASADLEPSHQVDATSFEDSESAHVDAELMTDVPLDIAHELTPSRESEVSEEPDLEVLPKFTLMETVNWSFTQEAVTPVSEEVFSWVRAVETLPVDQFAERTSLPGQVWDRLARAVGVFLFLAS